ncbi:MAG: hypothetical protein VXX39_04090 [Candidatus Thermoplasmatota archaeon]|nr:hypothetical protein [Candidatus Thermoplasmatota archaeon]
MNEMKIFLARVLTALHLGLFIFGLLGWLLPFPFVITHTLFMIGLRIHWEVYNGCILTDWEKSLLGKQSNQDRHFTRDLLVRIGFKSVSVELASKLLRIFTNSLIFLSIIVSISGYFASS